MPVADAASVYTCVGVKWDLFFSWEMFDTKNDSDGIEKQRPIENHYPSIYLFFLQYSHQIKGSIASLPWNHKHVSSFLYNFVFYRV